MAALRAPAAFHTTSRGRCPIGVRAAIPPLTRCRVFIALHRLCLITAPEAVPAAATGVVPAALEATFTAFPDPDQTDARVTFATFHMTVPRLTASSQELRQLLTEPAVMPAKKYRCAIRYRIRSGSDPMTLIAIIWFHSNAC